MKKYWMLICLVVGAMSCASDECANGKCDEVLHPDWGFSKLLVLEPDSGEQRWYADSRGETIDVVRLQSDGNSVVVVADDPCFPAPETFAISVWDGTPVELVASTGEISGMSCDAVVAPGIESLQFIDGYCVGIESATGDVVAVDSVDSSEAWRSDVGASTLSVFGSVLFVVAEVAVGGETHYRFMRIASANGMTLWQKQITSSIVALGADTTKIFLLDTSPFAVAVSTGDEVWRYDEKEVWPFDAKKDRGVLLGGVLFVERNGLKASDCVLDTDSAGM